MPKDLSMIQTSDYLLEDVEKFLQIHKDSDGDMIKKVYKISLMCKIESLSLKESIQRS